MANSTAVVNLLTKGKEPVLGEHPTRLEVLKALNWYSAWCDNEDARRWLLEWARARRYYELLELEQIDACWIPTTVAWLARIELRGSTLPDETKQWLYAQLPSLVSLVPKYFKPKAPQNKLQRVVRKSKTVNRDLVAEFDALIDTFSYKTKPKFSMKAWLREKKATDAEREALRAFVCPQVQEWKTARRNREYFRHLSEQDLTVAMAFWAGIGRDLKCK